MATGGERDGRAAGPDGWPVDGLLLAIGLACAAVYVLKGAGFVLDDWYFRRNAVFDGILHTAGQTGGDRPVGALVYMAFFGVIGPHPGVIILVLGAMNGLCALLLRRLVRWWASGWIALGAAGLWLVLPLRTSLEAWMSTGSAVLASILTLSALVLLARPEVQLRRVLLAAVLLALGALSYEALCVLGVPAALGIRVARTRFARREHLAALAVLPGIAFAWAYTHRLDGRHAAGGIRNPFPVLDANFGRGVAPAGVMSTLTLVAAVSGSILVARAALDRPSGQRWTVPAALLAIGWAATLWGVVPYLTYFYSPYGAGDRLNVLSAYGAALVWTGLVGALGQRRLVVGAATALLLVGIAARVSRAELWSRAGLDGGRVAAAIARAHPHPDRPFLVGPEPIVVDNVAAFVDHSNIDAAVQLAFGSRDVQAFLALTPADFAEADPDGFILFDQRGVSTLDEREGFLRVEPRILDGDGATSPGRHDP